MSDYSLYGQNMTLGRIRSEKKIGRLLKPNEVVHHVDGNHFNDDPENLQVISRGEHTRLHCTGRRLSEKTKRAISRLGKQHSEEAKYRISKALLGRHLSEETRRKIGEAKKGNQYGLGKTHIVTEEKRRRNSEAMIGNTHSLGHVYTPTEECRQRISESVKKSWAKRRTEHASFS